MLVADRLPELFTNALQAGAIIQFMAGVIP